MSGWLPIESAPKPHEWLKQRPYARFAIAKFYKVHDADGIEIDEWHMAWMHIASLSSDGFRLETSGIQNINGSASFLLRSDATHYMPVPGTPE